MKILFHSLLNRFEIFKKYQHKLKKKENNIDLVAMVVETFLLAIDLNGGLTLVLVVIYLDLSKNKTSEG